MHDEPGGVETDLYYPNILRRYLATVVDGLLLLVAFFAVSFVLQAENEFVVGLRVAIVLALFLIYEPLCTSKLCTIGQRLVGVRVRSERSLERISIPSAYARVLVKGLLGLVSFLTIPFNRKRRGIHDYATGSVAIDASALEQLPTGVMRRVPDPSGS